jgi:hypothetical protein
MAATHRISLLAVLALTTACPDCEPIEGFEPQGAFNPAILDLGPVVLDTACEPVMKLENLGGSELEVTTASLENKSGEFTNLRVPNFVGISGIGDVTVDYVSKSPLGRQSVTVLLNTNDPDDDGEITGTITALATDEEVGVARAYCGANAQAPVDVLDTLCALLDFGSFNIQNPTVPLIERASQTRKIKIVNEGNADMTIFQIALNDGNPDFFIQGVQQGTIITPFPAGGVVLPPGRQGSCGDAEVGDDNSIVINILYSPTGLGADTETFIALTSAVDGEGDTLEVPLSGFGSDIGILLSPDTLAFGQVAEGSTSTLSTSVSNVGTNNATVNTTCIDLGGDDVCDFDCTGGDPALDGALNCEVFKADGTTHEGKGFILDATDALPGGTDERVVKVTWSPVAGNAVIPAGTTIRFETAILNARVYTVRILGGATGLLAAAPTAPATTCGESVCLPASGTPVVGGTPCDWTGSAVIVLSNNGEATIDVAEIKLDNFYPSVFDDFALETPAGDPLPSPPGMQIAVGGSASFVVQYANSPNDFSCNDIINMTITHSGRNSPFVVPIQVVDGNL